MNVLHGPVNVASQASSLSCAENTVRGLNGLPGRSWSVDFDPRTLSSAADEAYPATDQHGLLGKANAVLAPLFYGLKNLRRFDVLHLYFGDSLLRLRGRIPALGNPDSPLWRLLGRHLFALCQGAEVGLRSLLDHADLPLWKLTGKRVFATFQGCDARLRTVAAKETVSACHDGACSVASCDEAMDNRRRRMIKRFVRYCDKIFCLNPDLLEFVPEAEFLPYASINVSLLEQERIAHDGPPIVAHAPSDPAIKGTAFVRAASEQLKEAHPHDLLLIQNVPHQEALKALAGADVLVDQLLVGWYGGAAVEGMALGLPVVAYLNEKHVARIPPAMREELPVVSATPESIGKVLAALLESPRRRCSLGEQGRAYVRRWHNPLKIARRVLALYEDPSQRFWDGYNPDD